LTISAAGKNNELAAVILGGSGFIGTHLINDFLADPRVQRIFVLDKNPPCVASDKIEFVRCDLSASIAWSPPSGTCHIQCFHLAALCREPGYPWEEYFSNNSLIATNVAAWASRVGIDNICFTSTAMVFRASDKRNSETDLPDPNTAYGISKALSEEIFRTWAAAQAGRRLYVLRPGVVFGKGCGENFLRLYQALKRNLFCYVGRNTTVKCSTYIKDLVRLLRAAGDGTVDTGIYHILFTEPLTMKKICAAFCEVFGWHRLIPILPYRLLVLATIPFRIADAVGLKNSIHPRRLQKLYESTDLSADKLAASGFYLEYNITEAIRDWRDDCLPDEPY
jgi:nucleoside-diphosphate-sugar epimerase